MPRPPKYEAGATEAEKIYSDPFDEPDLPGPPGHNLETWEPFLLGSDRGVDDIVVKLWKGYELFIDNFWEGEAAKEKYGHLAAVAEELGSRPDEEEDALLGDA